MVPCEKCLDLLGEGKRRKKKGKDFHSLTKQDKGVISYRKQTCKWSQTLKGKICPASHRRQKSYKFLFIYIIMPTYTGAGMINKFLIL